jgi:hypothetical protein
MATHNLERSRHHYSRIQEMWRFYWPRGDDPPRKTLPTRSFREEPFSYLVIKVLIVDEKELSQDTNMD